jgi:hypothetical protein
MVEPPVSYLESTIPAAVSEMAAVFGSTGCGRFACRVPASSNSHSLLRYFVRTTTVMARKKVTADELNAHAKENGYQRGAHGEKGSLRDRSKHVDRVKRDQNKALNRYVL